jgi:hypothetical protein
MGDVGPLIVVVSREEVETGDISPALSVFQSALSSKEKAMSLCDNMDIAFDGYNHDPRELFEIPGVRDFAYRLDDEFPYWLFFLSKRHLGLQCLTFCALPPFLTDEAKAQVFPTKIDELLSSRWFPAMNHMCSYVGFSEDEIEKLTNRVIDYIMRGKRD